MRAWLLFVVVGAIALLGPAASYVYYHAAYAREEHAVAPLRATLDSVRAELPAALTGADSARLLGMVRAREEGLGRRAYHLSHLGARLAQWWRFPSGPTLAMTAGVACLVAGFALRWRAPSR